MDKSELHKAAEEWLMQKGFNDSDYMDSGMIDHIADTCVYFHLHQTKKMLEGIIKKARIHQMIPDHTEYGGGYVDGASAVAGQIIELLKQLKQ